jgi:hypothetical protein
MLKFFSKLNFQKLFALIDILAFGFLITVFLLIFTNNKNSNDVGLGHIIAMYFEFLYLVITNLTYTLFSLLLKSFDADFKFRFQVFSSLIALFFGQILFSFNFIPHQLLIAYNLFCIGIMYTVPAVGILLCTKFLIKKL